MQLVQVELYVLELYEEHVLKTEVQLSIKVRRTLICVLAHAKRCGAGLHA